MTHVQRSSGSNTALLELAHSHETIYESMCIPGENRTARLMLPVDRHDSLSDNLEASYARNMFEYFNKDSASILHSTQSLQAKHLQGERGQRFTNHNVRISGENCIRHRMLPTNLQAEKSDRCSDATDACYATAMAHYIATRT